MIEAADRLDLVHEQAAFLGGRVDAGRHDLDRDVAIDRELARPVHGTEAAASDRLLDPEPPG